MKKPIFIILCFITIASLWYFQYVISINIPSWDDFHGVLLPVFDLFQDISISDKIKGFFSLNNEHRIANDRFFMLLVYLFSGEFNLKALALMGFINLIFLFLIIFKVARPYISNILYFVPVLFLLFQAQFYESLYTLMVPFQNFSVLLYILTCFYFLSHNSKFSFHFSILFAVLALFSHGNGLLAFMIGGVILIFQKKYKLAAIWWILSAVLIGFYFVGYQKPGWNPNVSASENPIKAFLYIFEFLGAYTLNLTNISAALSTSKIKNAVSILTSLSFIITFFYVLLKKYPVFKKHNIEYFNKLRHSPADQFFIASIGFFLATGLMIGLTRTGFPMVSRYTINSAILFSLIYLFLVINIEKNKILVYLSSVITAILLLFSYHNVTDDAFFKKKNIIADAINWRETGTWVNQYALNDHVRLLNPLLIEPHTTKAYIFPENNIEKFIDLKPDDKITSVICYEDREYLEIEEQDVIKEKDGNGIFYILVNDQNRFIFSSFNKRHNLIESLKTGNYFSGLHKSSFPKFLIPKGKYQLEKLRIENGKAEKFLIKSEVNI